MGAVVAFGIEFVFGVDVVCIVYLWIQPL